MIQPLFGNSCETTSPYRHPHQIELWGLYRSCLFEVMTKTSSGLRDPNFPSRLKKGCLLYSSNKLPNRGCYLQVLIYSFFRLIQVLKLILYYLERYYFTYRDNILCNSRWTTKTLKLKFLIYHSLKVVHVLYGS
jgi:hypothetical protein